MFKALRNQVADALAHESATGELTCYVCGVFADMCGNDPACAAKIELNAAQAIGFIRQYVGSTPRLLDAVHDASRAAGVESSLIPVLVAAEDYFLRSVDFIPDHLGLVGVLDDAYLAHSLLQQLSDSHRASTGAPLLPIDLARANALVRHMLGPTATNSLDAAVQEALGLPEVQLARESLAQRIKSLPLAPLELVTSIPDAAGMNLQLGALGNP